MNSTKVEKVSRLHDIGAFFTIMIGAFGAASLDALIKGDIAQAIGLLVLTIFSEWLFRVIRRLIETPKAPKPFRRWGLRRHSAPRSQQSSPVYERDPYGSRTIPDSLTAIEFKVTQV